MKSTLKETKEGVILPVKVVPRASKNSITGWKNDELKVRLNAVPEKGEANEELIAFLAKTWKIPKSALSIYSGETSRHKKLLVRGVTADTLLQKIAAAKQSS
jgi:uncharacterized protein